MTTLLTNRSWKNNEHLQSFCEHRRQIMKFLRGEIVAAARHSLSNSRVQHRLGNDHEVKETEQSVLQQQPNIHAFLPIKCNKDTYAAVSKLHRSLCRKAASTHNSYLHLNYTSQVFNLLMFFFVSSSKWKDLKTFSQASFEKHFY